MLVACVALGACHGPTPSHTPVPPRTRDSETNQIIAALLTDMRTVSAPKPARGKRAAAEAESPADTFEEDRERIRSSMGQWAQGTGVALRFMKQSTGERLSLIFVDETAPLYQPETNMWVIQAAAHVTGGKVVGHLVLFLRNIKAGRYHGDDHQKEAVVGVLIGESTWNGESPQTAWSMNSESWCEVDLQPAAAGGFEGSIRAKLVDNRGSGYIQVESGYLFIRQ